LPRCAICLLKAAQAALTELPMVKAASRLAPAAPSDGDERAAPRLEERPGCAREPHMGEELERIAVLPVGVGELEEIAALGGAGVVDQHVEAAELALHGIDKYRRRAFLAQVDVDDHGLAALAAIGPRFRRQGLNRAL
jgi:hypothetical protein